MAFPTKPTTSAQIDRDRAQCLRGYPCPNPCRWPELDPRAVPEPNLGGLVMQTCATSGCSRTRAINPAASPAALERIAAQPAAVREVIIRHWSNVSSTLRSDFTPAGEDY